MSTVYTTITDVHYLVRAWALYRSLLPWLGQDDIFAFYCVDDDAADLLASLNPAKAWIVRTQEYETPSLAEARGNRARNEYCWTCKPAIILHAFNRQPSLEWGVYFDSDMLAFADPQRELARAGGADALLTPHRWSGPDFAAFEPTVGQFNAGFAAFRNTAGGRKGAQWWLEQCLKICPAVPVEGAYADQKYLDYLPQQVNVHISGSKGLNAAPWNISAYGISVMQQSVFVDDDILILYHFQGLRIHARFLFDIYPGPLRIPATIGSAIYSPYLAALRGAFNDLATVQPGFSKGIRPLSARQWLTQVANVVRGTNNLRYAAE